MIEEPSAIVEFTPNLVVQSNSDTLEKINSSILQTEEEKRQISDESNS